jgi:hypothetical protein
LNAFPPHLKSKPTLQLISALSSEAITHWLEALPAAPGAGHLGLLLNDAGIRGFSLHWLQEEPGLLARAGFGVVKGVSACACCLGALPLRTELVRLLREPLDHIVVISTHWAHLPALEASLSGPPFDLYAQRLPSRLLLTHEQAGPDKKATLAGLFEKWPAEWVFTN